MFGTDGEIALVEAFQQQCKNAIHLTCFTHCRKTLKENFVSSMYIKEYVFEIFGGQRGTTFVEGLVDATSDSDFDKTCSP